MQAIFEAILNSMHIEVSLCDAKYSPKIYGEFAAETFHQRLNLGE